MLTERAWPQALAERTSDLLSAADEVNVGALAQEFCEGFASKIPPGRWYDPDNDECSPYTYGAPEPEPEYCDGYTDDKVRWRDGATSTGAPACSDHDRNKYLLSQGLRCALRYTLHATTHVTWTLCFAEDELNWQVGVDVARSVVDKVAEALAN